MIEFILNMKNKIRNIQKFDKYIKGVMFIVLGVFVTLPLAWSNIKNIIGYIFGPIMIIIGIYMIVDEYNK